MELSPKEKAELERIKNTSRKVYTSMALFGLLMFLLWLIVK